MELLEAEKFLSGDTATETMPDDGQDFMAAPAAEPSNYVERANESPSEPSIDLYTLAPQTYKVSSSFDSPNPPGIAGRIGLRELGRLEDEKFRQEATSPGVTLDTETGIPAWDRAMLGFRTAKENQLSYLESKYGPGTVRDSSKGLIVRVPDQENPSQPKDLLVDEDKMTGKDFIDLLGAVPEIAASLFTRRVGSKLPFLAGKEGAIGVGRDIATSTVLAETTGAAKDVAANVYDRQIIDLPGVTKERSKMAGVDVAFGAVSYPAARFFQWMKNPAAGYRGQTQFDALAARQYFKEKYGVDVPLSIGESTGAPIFGRTEAFIEKMPGGSEPIREVKRAQESAFRKLQNILIGSANESDEAVGQKAIDEIRSKIEPITEKTASITQRLGAAAQSNIEGIVSGVTLPERELYKSALGADIRKAVIGKRNIATDEADRLYGIVKSMPGGEGKVFSGKGLQDDFKSILKSLPAPAQTVETPSALVDAFGREIKNTSKEMSVLREFVPPNVLARLKSVTDLKGAAFSLSDLQQMRREVYDDIAKGEGVPGLGTHYLNDIGKSLTKAIDEGVSALPNGDLKAALLAANKHYREVVVPFNRQGITELFRNADEAGHLGDSEIVGRILSGSKAPERWNLMKETLGTSSNEFNRMRRAAADNIIEQSRLPGEETIDAKSFIKNLHDFRMANREIADDVFGKNVNELFRQGRFLEYAQGDKLNAGELQKLLANPSANADMLQQLIRIEQTRDKTFKNSILKAIGSGKLTEETLKPSDFVNRMLQTAEPAEVNQVLGLLGDKPELLQDLRQKTFEKVFRDAARGATAGDVNLIMSGENSHILSGVKIAEALKSKTYTQKIKSILGDEGFNDLTQYVKLSAAPEAREASFKAAGGLAAGAQIASIERRGPIAFLSSSARNFIFSTLLSRPPLRQWLTSIPEQPGKLSLLLSSPPFLEAVTKEFGEGTAAEAFMSNVKQAIDRSMTSTPAPQRKPFGPAWKQKEEYWRKQLDGFGASTNSPVPLSK